jgi:trimethylamine corrinoid protein
MRPMTLCFFRYYIAENCSRKESVMESIFLDLKQGIIDLDEPKVKGLTNQVVTQAMDCFGAIEWCSEGIREVGARFETGEIFLPELMKAGKIMKGVLAVLEPEIKKMGRQKKTLGRVIIGTVQGDMHDIGKDIVSTMLFLEGFEVYDLGKDVSISRFLGEAKRVRADIVAASALLSTTMIYQKDLVNAFVQDGSREKVKILVGGSPVTPEWAEKIGADGYGDNAVEAARIAKRVLKGRKA